jgi:hypothetical protein
MRSVNRQLIAVINTVITVAGAFTFGFYGMDYMYSGGRLDFAVRMLIGVLLGTVVFFADLWFIVKGMGEDGEGGGEGGGKARSREGEAQ